MVVASDLNKVCSVFKNEPNYEISTVKDLRLNPQYSASKKESNMKRHHMLILYSTILGPKVFSIKIVHNTNL
jgi:hypothetical protein